jgi:hypothetical protein
VEAVLHAVGFIVTSAIVLLVVIFLIAGAAVRLEFIRDKAPWLQHWLERRHSVVYLLMVAIFLQLGLLSELMLKEVPPIPIISSPLIATIPAPIIQDEARYEKQEVNKTTVLPILQRQPSLRDRANKLADELQDFTRGREKHLPEVHEKEGMTSEQVQAELLPQRTYQQETEKIYLDRFSLRVVTIVQEFKAMGVDVSQIEGCAAYGICPTMPIPIQLHAFAARLDDNGNLRR